MAKLFAFLGGGAGMATGAAVVVVGVAAGVAYYSGAFGPVANDASEPGADVAAAVPAPEAESPVAAPVPEAPEPEPEADQAPTGPTFDVVRVEEDGAAIVAGQAEAGATVEIVIDDEVVAEVEAGRDGKFAGFFNVEASGDAQVMSLQSDDGSVGSQQVIIAPVAEAVSAANAPSAPDLEPVDEPEVAVLAEPEVEVTQEDPVESDGAPAPTASAQSEVVAQVETPDETDPAPALANESATAEVTPTAPESGEVDTAEAEEETAQDTAPLGEEDTQTVAVAEPTVSESPVTEQVTSETSEELGEDSVVEAEVKDDPVETQSEPQQVAAAQAEPEVKPETEPKAEPEAEPETSTEDQVDTAAVETPAEDTPAQEAKAEETPVKERVTAALAEATETAEALTVEPQVAAPSVDAEPALTDSALETAPEPAVVAEAAPEPTPATEPSESAQDPVSDDVPTSAPVETAQTEEAPAAPRAIFLADDTGVRVLQTASQAAPDAQTSLLGAISYDAQGDVALTGSAGGEFIRVYLDNTPIITSRIEANGNWQASLPEIDTGVYTLRVDELDESGDVVARVETPFKREDAAVLEAASAPDKKIQAITVQPGATLWAIARDRYGSGVLYTKVFDANKEAIRDPDLIYPGQVFDLPDN